MSKESKLNPFDHPDDEQDQKKEKKEHKKWTTDNVIQLIRASNNLPDEIA
jgi:hypothetical protein